MYQFGWTERMVGISLGVVGLMTGLVQGLLIRWINPKIGNEKSILYGLALYSVGMLLYAFATEGWMMLAFTVPYCLGGICGPALQAVITKSVSSGEQGELQGALTSLMSATSIVGPPLMTNLFYYFTHDKAPFKFPGAPFFLGFILMAASTLIIMRIFRKKKSRNLN